MKSLRFVAPPVLSLLSLVAGCGDGEGSGDGFGGVLFVESCSLGCNSGQGGGQVFCSIVNTARNQDITVTFSQDVDVLTADPSTFRVIEVQNGTTPGGSFLLDATNPKRLIFRPSLTFDELGTPQYGLKANTAYQVTIPGEAQGDNPPYILSRAGRPNQSRLQCTIFTDQGIIDPVPGPPTFDALVDRVTAYDATGAPSEFEEDVEITRQPIDTVDVFRFSPITVVFNDVMNPASVADNASGTAPFIRVQTDQDGNLGTTADRTTVAGTFEVDVELELLRTVLVFTPDTGYPSGGDAGAPPDRPVVLQIQEGVIDLVLNQVPPVELAFYPERVDFTSLVLTEAFDDAGVDDSFEEDAARSAANWSGGRLTRTLGGGAGRYGDLIVTTGEVVALDTDSQAFPLPNKETNLMGNPDVDGDYPGFDGPTFTRVPIEVTDGAFEFEQVRIESGGVLRLGGTGPARIFSRGPIRVESGGLIDLSGGTPEQHDSSIARPEAGLHYVDDGTGTFEETPVDAEFGAGGPAGGDGGFGGDRFNYNGSPTILALTEPGTDALDMGPGVATDGEGRAGGPVGRSTAPALAVTRGRGGAMFPSSFPASTTDEEALAFVLVSDCICHQVGGAGSGGAYALNGTPGVALSDVPAADDPAGAPNQPGDTPPGTTDGNVLEPPAEDNVNYVARILDFYGGYLRGGAGGGGGGNHPFRTGALATFDDDCLDASFGSLFTWHDHSGAPGGGGGGACQLLSGRLISVGGVIDASGGSGGSAATNPTFNPEFGRYAQPGGGGAGGALRLQAPMISIPGLPGRLTVSGGLGGESFLLPASRGGDGGPGLVRIEDTAGTISRASLAPAILPFDPVDDSLRWVSVAPGDFAILPRRRPDAFNGSVSCWLRPEGNFLRLNFALDEGTAPEDQGWNIDVVYKPTGQPEFLIPFRGDNVTFPQSFEDMFGNLLNHDAPAPQGSPVAIRFQGAQLTLGAGTHCDVVLGPGGGVVAGSVTPWVQHPAELNAFPLAPNAVRFAVVFDPGAAVSGAQVRGVANLVIKVTPE